MVFLGSVLSAQNSKLEAIYNKIPPIPDKLLCDNVDNYSETIALLESLLAQLEEIRYELDEDLKINGDQTYNSLTAGFPTDEELKIAEKLSEEEQQVFWEQFEAKQSQTDKTIAENTIKYQAEKEMITKQVSEYQNKLLEMVQEIGEIHYEAGKIKSDKRQSIYNACMENNTLSKQGQLQIENISAEFCSVVSPVMLKKIRFEYNNLKKNMLAYRRFTIIELVEFSPLTEEVVCEQNAALLDLNDLEILNQFINFYKSLYNILPGALDNQNWERF